MPDSEAPLTELLKVVTLYLTLFSYGVTAFNWNNILTRTQEYSLMASISRFLLKLFLGLLLGTLFAGIAMALAFDPSFSGSLSLSFTIILWILGVIILILTVYPGCLAYGILMLLLWIVKDNLSTYSQVPAWLNSIWILFTEDYPWKSFLFGSSFFSFLLYTWIIISSFKSPGGRRDSSSGDSGGGGGSDSDGLVVYAAFPLASDSGGGGDAGDD